MVMAKGRFLNTVFETFLDGYYSCADYSSLGRGDGHGDSGFGSGNGKGVAKHFAYMQIMFHSFKGF